MNGKRRFAKRGFMRFCALNEYNCKTDTFVPNANLVGNWPAAFKVGSRSNGILRGSANGDVPGTGLWIGEVAELGWLGGSSATPLAAAWVNDQSRTVSGTGNGDYTPGAGSALPVIPAGMAAYSIDQKGRAVVAGTSRVGALVQV